MADELSQGVVSEDTCLAHLGPLLEGLTAPWPRRGHSLLELGCGGGAALERMWAFGFDVTGLERVPHQLELARARFGGRADFLLGAYDAAPFDDSAFDYVLLCTVFEHLPRHATAPVVAEAVRLASKSVLCIFPNSWSLARMASGLPGWLRARLCGAHVLAKGQNPLALLRQLRRCGTGRRYVMRGILPGPGCTWSAETRLGKYVNTRLLPGPFGSYVGLRMDMAPAVGVTGLPLRVARLTMARTSSVATRTAVRTLPEPD